MDLSESPTAIDCFFAAFAEEASSYLHQLLNESCYGCLYERPSQRDHDVCLMMDRREALILYFERLIELTPRSKVMANYINQLDKHNIGMEAGLEPFIKSDPFYRIAADSEKTTEIVEILMNL